jgi:uncharacterized protein (TIGR04255 family)
VARPADLPDYRRPPIDEVAIGLQFDPAVLGFTGAHVGLYWQTVRADYPRSESHPRLESPVEVLDSPQLAPQVIQIQLQGNPQGRTWLLSEDGAYVLQIQNNRLVRNWRRRDAPYPHFDDLSTEFLACYDGFLELLSAENLALPQIQQVELTYINWITDMEMAEFLRPGNAAQVSATGVDPSPEDQTWAARYLIRGTESKPVARLHVQCTPAFRADPGTESGLPVRGTQLALIFRAPTVGRVDNEQLATLLGTGRASIVRTFTELTTPVAHQKWDRIQ